MVLMTKIKKRRRMAKELGKICTDQDGVGGRAVPPARAT